MGVVLRLGLVGRRLPVVGVGLLLPLGRGEAAPRQRAVALGVGPGALALGLGRGDPGARLVDQSLLQAPGRVEVGERRLGGRHRPLARASAAR